MFNVEFLWFELGRCAPLGRAAGAGRTAAASQGPGGSGWSSLPGRRPRPVPACRSRSPHRGRQTHVMPLTSLTRANSAKYCILSDRCASTACTQHSVGSLGPLGYGSRRPSRTGGHCRAVIWRPVRVACEDARGSRRAWDVVRSTGIPGSEAPRAQMLSGGPRTPTHPCPLGMR